MQKITKPVGTRDETLGSIEIPQFDAIEEATDMYGQQIVLHLLNKSISSELERVGRDNYKKEGATPESVQEIVDAYRPGVRTTKPTLKNFTALATEFVEVGDVENLKAAYALMQEENVEAAYNFLAEAKMNGALSK